VDDVGRVLPVKPYASYIGGCSLTRASAFPTKLYFVEGTPYTKKVAPSDYHIFYVNLSDTEKVKGKLIRNKTSTEFLSKPDQLITIVPAGYEIDYVIETPYKQAILCIHQTLLNDKAVELTKGRFNRAEVACSDPADSPLLCSVLKEIELVQTDKVVHDSYYLESLYDVMMAKIVNRYSSMKKTHIANKTHAPANMKKVLDYLHSNLDREIKIVELAMMMELSPYHFTRIFKEYLGVSPYQYILNVKLEKSKDYLINTDTSIVSIASILGFSSQSHFQSFFKKQTGLTPKKFRSKPSL
jgi:AraC family transcriptional regulator